MFESLFLSLMTYVDCKAAGAGTEPDRGTGQRGWDAGMCCDHVYPFVCKTEEERLLSLVA